MRLSRFKDSVNGKEFRIHSLILVGLVLATLMISEYSKTQDAQKKIVSEKALPLWCFANETDSLWRSVAKEGCGPDKSLGAIKISAPKKRHQI